MPSVIVLRRYVRSSSGTTLPSVLMMCVKGVCSTVSVRTPIICCFSGLILTPPVERAGLWPNPGDRSSAAYTGSIFMPQGARPGSLDVWAGFIGST